MKTLCIILARGGSKRIPRKNIRPFLGKPIMAYSIQAARESGLFDTIMVSTDDDEMADAARQYGADVPFYRSPETASDYATTASVLIEVLNRYADQGMHFDRACCLYATAPFVTASRLQEAFAKLAAGGYDVVYPVVRFRHPLQQAALLQQERLVWLEPQYVMPPTPAHDLTPAYHDAGQFYVFMVPSFQQTGKLLTGNTGGIEISDQEAQDIDNIIDWQLAELKYHLLMAR